MITQRSGLACGRTKPSATETASFRPGKGNENALP